MNQLQYENIGNRISLAKARNVRTSKNHFNNFLRIFLRKINPVISEVNDENKENRADYDPPLKLPYNGFIYKRNKAKRDRFNVMIGYYCCCTIQSTQCKGTLILKETGEIITKNEHSCNSVVTTDIIKLQDVRNEMRNLAQDLAIKSINVPARTLAKGIIVDTNTKYNGLIMHSLNEDQLMGIINRSRETDFGDKDSIARQITLFLCINSDQPFLRFDNHYLVEGNDGMEVMLNMKGWAHPKLLFLFRHHKNRGMNLFIDCTFSIVPVKYSQLLIIMVYSVAYDKYIPVFYILLQGKQKMSYIHSFQCALHATGFNMGAITTSCDFEKGLIEAIKFSFKDTTIIGCIFHFKQALRRKLIQHHIPRDMISSLMDDKGLINILPIIPIEEINSKGIPYIRAKFDEGNYTDQFDKFWRYFQSNWVNKYNPNLWNINGIIEKVSTENLFISRTNNPLERYNLHLKTLFPLQGRPSMPQFITILQREADRYVSDLELIEKGKASRPRHSNTPVIHPLPEDYKDFNPIVITPAVSPISTNTDFTGTALA